MHHSEIKLHIALDDDKMPDEISWQAPDGGVPEPQGAKALLLGLWDGDEKTAMRIDLWTKKMMVDEMNDFFFQSFFGMADTYVRATRNGDLGKMIKEFAQQFRKAADEALAAAESENKK